jgi:hypothetical protein
MATIENIMEGARSYLRDFPRYFTASVAIAGTPRVIQLPHRNVAPSELYVEAKGPNSTAVGKLKRGDVVPDEDVFTYTLDVREGLLKILEAPTNGWEGAVYFNIDGYYFEWVSPGDMRFYTEVIIAEHGTDNASFQLHNVGDAEEDLLSLGAALEACWALMFEYSRDIDVSTPEAIGVPATQRFRQVEDLLMRLIDKYKTKANMLGVGLERVRVSQIRRQSYTTNRLVPIYKHREWDDASFPTRLFPPIDQTAPSTPAEGFTPAKAITGYYEEIKPYTDVTAND